LTVAFALSVTTQAPVPVQPLDQPVKVEPEPAVGVRVTAVPLGKVALQVPGQLIPAGLEVTEPDPVTPTVNVRLTGPTVVNVAVTDRFVDMVRLQAPVPVQAPDQPVNVAPLAGVAVSETDALVGNAALQVPGQLTPAGVDVTVPDPVTVVVRVRVVGTAAVQSFVADAVASHGAVLSES
jgi:hypothetical protein